jgi:hypothetical protein
VPDAGDMVSKSHQSCYSDGAGARGLHVSRRGGREMSGWFAQMDQALDHNGEGCCKVTRPGTGVSFLEGGLRARSSDVTVARYRCCRQDTDPILFRDRRPDLSPEADACDV